jgi:phosphate transport system substrate-binding protein
MGCNVKTKRELIKFSWAIFNVFSIILVMFLFGCSKTHKNSINIVGSTSVQPFAEMLAQEFERLNPGVHVEVQGGGSTAGIQSVLQNIADIGTCSRQLAGSETNLNSILIAKDGLAIVVHPSNSIDNLSREQIRDIFSGKITSWKELGGKDQPIRIITREEGSGTREAFVKMVMGKSRISRKALNQESNGAVKELVKNDPCGIGYMSLGLVGNELKMVSVDGIKPTIDEAKAGKYPLVRPFLFVTKNEIKPESQKFIDFVLSSNAQEILRREGLIPIK